MSSMSNAGANKSRQLIAVIGPWSLVNDDFGPYSAPTGFSKVQFSTTGDGAGYQIGIYDAMDPLIEDFIWGKHYPYLGCRLSPNPPPYVPSASYGAAAASAGVLETSYKLTIGPSSQGGTGTEANPIIVDGVQSQALLSSYPIYYCRAKVLAVAGATGTVNVWATAIP